MARKTSRSEWLAAVCLYATPVSQEHQALPVDLSDVANPYDRRDQRQALSGATFFRVDDDGTRSETFIPSLTPGCVKGDRASRERGHDSQRPVLQETSHAGRATNNQKTLLEFRT
jgi:hypothetical protein